MDDSIEEWKPVVGFENDYQVSNKGRLRKLKLTKPTPDAHGYKRYAMTINGFWKTTRSVHSMVAEAFLGPRPEGMVIDHLDGNPGNNRIENLRYASLSENRRGNNDRNRGFVLNAEIVARIREELKTTSGRELARRHGVQESTISRIKNGKRWAK